MLTTQDVFDTVATHLLKQGEKALRVPGGVSCVYHAADGKKCAAGALIHPAAYTEVIEGKGALHTDVKAALLASGVSSDDFDLVQALQDLHDQHEPDEWPVELRAVAREFGLATTLLP